jgi:hypothetical protein
MIPEIDRAYAYFNQVLFANQLPRVVISIQRRPVKDGIWAEHTHQAYWTRGARETDHFADEIMFNATRFKDQTPIAWLAMLVHEMVHVWHDNVSEVKPKGKGDYHDATFAAKMEELGLIPTHNGKMGGARTGYGMHELVVPGGVFERAANDFLAKGFWLWSTNPFKRVSFG